MGLDFVDAVFRIEKEFDIRLDRENSQQFFLDRGEEYRNFWGKGIDLRVGDLFAYVEQQICIWHSTVPDDAWPRFQRCIVEATGVDLDEVHSDAWIMRDLDMN